MAGTVVTAVEKVNIVDNEQQPLKTSRNLQEVDNTPDMDAAVDLEDNVGGANLVFQPPAEHFCQDESCLDLFQPAADHFCEDEL